LQTILKCQVSTKEELREKSIDELKDILDLLEKQIN